MTRRRWIADEVAGNTAALLGDHATHLARVLRAKVGQEFDIATDGAVRLGRVTSISKDRVEFALGEELLIKPAPEITLALAIFKFDRLEWAIEKCTEIGVARIVPVIARRTDSHLAKAAEKRRERWQRIANQASEQSRRCTPTEIAAPVKVRELGSSANLANQSADRIVLSESEEATRLRDVVRSQKMVLAIGPEGGWSDDELGWFRDSGWTSASLGDTILRAETAAIVATALAFDAMH